jgi:hypothetical protein
MGDPPVVKFNVVFAGAFSMSWTLTVLLRKVPPLARMI